MPTVKQYNKFYYPGEMITLTCVLPDPGYPAVEGFKWFQGNEKVILTQTKEANYSFSASYANTRDKYTCRASTRNYETVPAKGVKINFKCKFHF